MERSFSMIWNHEQNKESVLFYTENYEATIFDFVQQSTQYVKDPIENICRFCGNKGTFKKKAHAIPEAIGNKSIVQKNECDECNSTVFSPIEEHLARYLQISLVTSAIKGKNGIPTIKNRDNFRFGKNKGLDGVAICCPGESLVVDTENKQMKLQYPIKSQKYIPLNAAKAFCKSILSVLSYDDFQRCNVTRQWLMNSDKTKDIAISSFPVLRTFIPGPNPFGKGRLIILKRKTNIRAPFIWGVFEFGCFRYQIMLPFVDDDVKLLESGSMNVNVPFYFLEFDNNFYSQYGNPVFGIDNLASMEAKEDVCSYIDFSFSDMYKIGTEPKTLSASIPLPAYPLKAMLLCKKDGATTKCGDFVGTFKSTPRLFLSYQELSSPISFNVQQVDEHKIVSTFTVDMKQWEKNNDKLNNLPGYDIIQNMLDSEEVLCETFVAGFPKLVYPIEDKFLEQFRKEMLPLFLCVNISKILNLDTTYKDFIAAFSELNIYELCTALSFLMVQNGPIDKISLFIPDETSQIKFPDNNLSPIQFNQGYCTQIGPYYISYIVTFYFSNWIVEQLSVKTGNGWIIKTQDTSSSYYQVSNIKTEMKSRA